MPPTFSNQNLQGRSFKDQDLTECDFSNSDIRSADFTNAILYKANFSNVRAGQQLRWFLCSLVILFILSAVVGLIIGWGSGIVGYFMFVPDSSYQEGFQEGELSNLPIIAAIILPPILFIFTNTLVKKGLNSSLGFYLLIVASMLAVSAAIIPDASSTILALILFLFILCFVSATVVNAISCSSALFALGKVGAFTTVLINFMFVVFGVYEGASIDSLDQYRSKLLALSIGFALSAYSIVLSLYVGRKANLEDERYSLIYKLSVHFSSVGGTKFCSANCTDANFSDSLLRSVDLRQANLKRTRFHGAQKLSQSLLGNGHLKSLKIRSLITSGSSENQNFDGQDLRDINLASYSLANSSFKAANLCEANLKGVDFSGANLNQAQLYKADLTSACLTGAYIQDWGISTDTKLKDVKCSHIYMRNPTKSDPDPCRKPDNKGEYFEEGDFEDFIAPIIKTLDLYQQQNLDPRAIEVRHKSLDLIHHNGVDPSAAALALSQLVERNPDASIEVVAVEGRGNEKVRLQARVSNEADRSSLSKQYFDEYNKFNVLPSENLQGVFVSIAEKDQQILRLEKMLKTAIQQPRFYVETYQNQGEFIMSQSKGNISISGVQGDVSGIAAAGENQEMTGVVVGEVSGSVTNSINQLSSSPDPDTLGLKELLTQLQKSIETETRLSEEDKAEALEQVKMLAEAGQNPEDNGLQKTAKTAMKILKGTAASLPDATELVEACTKLLPAIATLLVLV